MHEITQTYGYAHIWAIFLELTYMTICALTSIHKILKSMILHHVSFLICQLVLHSLTCKRNWLYYSFSLRLNICCSSLWKTYMVILFLLIVFINAWSGTLLLLCIYTSHKFCITWIQRIIHLQKTHCVWRLLHSYFSNLCTIAICKTLFNCINVGSFI